MKLSDLKEATVSRNDPAMDDYYDNKEVEDTNTAGAPYLVRWSGQSHEWYGDGDPDQGKGRYKPKGNGGKIVAINIPSHDAAQQVADMLDSAYEENRFPDDAVYGDWGKDYYFVQYQGASVQSMKDMDGYDKETLRYAKPIDYSKGQRFSL